MKSPSKTKTNACLRLCVAILLFLFGLINTHAVTIYKQQGDTLIYSTPINSVPQITTFACSIIIDNPTVIFIDSVKLNNEKLNIKKEDYHTLNCQLNTTNIRNPLLQIFATCLYGNDTVANINITKLIINQSVTLTDLPPINVIIPNNQHTYTRFAKITNIYPIPCSANNDFYIEYLIDNTCDVTINVINIYGETVIKYQAKEQPPNKYILTSALLKNYTKNSLKEILSSGIYYIQLITNTGNDIQFFVVEN